MALKFFKIYSAGNLNNFLAKVSENDIELCEGGILLRGETSSLPAVI